MEKNLLHSDEILDVAVELEQEGLAFYQACLKASPGPQIAPVFRHLIDQEQRHVRIFSQMKETLRTKGAPSAYSEEVRSHAERLMGSFAFGGTKEALSIASEIIDALEALDLALTLERKSIVLYSGLKQFMPSTEVKIIENVISEEHDHIRRLMELLTALES